MSDEEKGKEEEEEEGEGEEKEEEEVRKQKTLNEDEKKGLKKKTFLSFSFFVLLCVKDEAAAAKVKIKFEPRKWNAVVLWSYDIMIDTCAICRGIINDICIDCQANQASATSDECTIAWGYCNHAFHFHCISKWLRKRPNCPLDNQEWEFHKFGTEQKKMLMCLNWLIFFVLSWKKGN